MGWGALTDMALTEEEKADCGLAPAVVAQDTGPQYPWGLRFSLTKAEMDKLGLEADCEVGTPVDLRCFGTVTSVSSNKRSDGTSDSRVEIQLERIAIDDDE